MKPQGSPASQTNVWDLPTAMSDSGGYIGIHRGTTVA